MFFYHILRFFQLLQSLSSSYSNLFDRRFKQLFVGVNSVTNLYFQIPEKLVTVLVIILSECRHIIDLCPLKDFFLQDKRFCDRTVFFAYVNLYIIKVSKEKQRVPEGTVFSPFYEVEAAEFASLRLSKIISVGII